MSVESELRPEEMPWQPSGLLDAGIEVFDASLVADARSGILFGQQAVIERTALPIGLRARGVRQITEADCACRTRRLAGRRDFGNRPVLAVCLDTGASD